LTDASAAFLIALMRSSGSATPDQPSRPPSGRFSTERGAVKGSGGGESLRARPRAPTASPSSERPTTRLARSGAAAASRPARASRSSAPGAGDAPRAGAAGAPASWFAAASAGRSKSAPRISAPETPSIAAWCTVATSATLAVGCSGSFTPSTKVILHSGRERSSGCASSQAMSAESSRKPPGAGSSVRSTCARRSTSPAASSVQYGRPRSSGIVASRRRNATARPRREPRTARKRSTSRRSAPVPGSSSDRPPTVIGARADSRTRKPASRPESWTSELAGSLTA
jgi:hypothetical protein